MSSEELDKKIEKLYQELLDANKKNAEKLQAHSSLVSRPLRIWRNVHPNPYRDGRQYVRYDY